VPGLGTEIRMAEYRAGNSKSNAPIKIAALTKVPDVTLKRGVIGSLDLFEWLRAVADGAPDQLRTVTIKLLSEDRSEVAVQWVLTNARPVKYTGPTLNGTGTDVAIEELVLSAERIEMA